MQTNQVAEMRHKLNALLLYKYQHSKATRELAEVRQALTNLQKGKADDDPIAAAATGAENSSFAVGKNLPASGYAGIRSAGIRQVGGRNRNSTSSGESALLESIHKVRTQIFQLFGPPPSLSVV